MHDEHHEHYKASAETPVQPVPVSYFFNDKMEAYFIPACDMWNCLVGKRQEEDFSDLLIFHLSEAVMLRQTSVQWLFPIRERGPDPKCPRTSVQSGSNQFLSFC